MYDILKFNFQHPTPDFTPYPFWLLNDELEEGELIRQIDDFKAHGIYGFIPHPRMGLSRNIPYMSERWLDLVELCVKYAKEQGMTVILYDEASYPSGSCCGQVVAADPSFASRCLRMNDLNDYTLGEGERIVATVGGHVFIEGFTGGTIRGVHEGQDDGQPDAPASADLLNPKATATFIELTHEKYFRRLGKYFGETIIGIFTDEPSLTGRRNVIKGSISWTAEFLYDFIEAGGCTEWLPLLFGPENEENAPARLAYNRAIRSRLAECYYKPLSDWCKNHAIVLTGHPAHGGETDVQRFFGIPGQDLVWRWVEPGTELTAPESVVGKCSADSARHLGAPRNMNEVLGVCGKQGNPWDFTVSDMLWYFNYLFARGVNMLVLHAFYYSLRTPLQYGERPPDVGPGNIWWKYYNRIAEYIKRMCWLNTSAPNRPYCAVLTDGITLPVESVRELYERRIDFNYLDMGVFESKAEVARGTCTCSRYRYDVICLPGDVELTEGAAEKLKLFEMTGGRVLRGDDFAEELIKFVLPDDIFIPDGEDIGRLRLVRLTKCGIPYILLVNEGDTAMSGRLCTNKVGACEEFNPWTGGISPADIIAADEKTMTVAVTVQPRIPTIIAVNPDMQPVLHMSRTLTELTAYTIDSDKVTITKRGDAEYFICADEVRDLADIFVNYRSAGTMMFIPFEVDVTDYIKDGDNRVTAEITGSMANKYGKPVPTGISGLRLEERIYN